MHIELILCAVIIIQAILHHIERRDLYNRIMCRDINDYNHAKARDKPAKTVSRHEEKMKAWRDPNGGDKR